jgi:hypothetical protein
MKPPNLSSSLKVPTVKLFDLPYIFGIPAGLSSRTSQSIMPYTISLGVLPNGDGVVLPSFSSLLALGGETMQMLE